VTSQKAVNFTSNAVKVSNITRYFHLSISQKVLSPNIINFYLLFILVFESEMELIPRKILKKSYTTIRTTTKYHTLFNILYTFYTTVSIMGSHITLLHYLYQGFCTMARWWSEGPKHVAIKIRITKYIVVFDSNW
jgi:hypothetical protein